LDAAAKTAQSIGANTFQYFTRNPRGGAARTIGEAEKEKWSRLRLEYDINPIVGHLPYTVNMAAPVDKTYEFARMVVRDDLLRMDAVGTAFLVVHPGSHSGSGRQEGLKRITGCLEEVFNAFAGQTMLLLETMAGQGSEIGLPADLKEIMAMLGWPAGLGVCIDSCHLTAAGYDFLRREEVERLVCELEGTVGMDRVLAMHLNDTRFPPGSRRDRHELIGKGYLGRKGVMNLITHPALAGLPILLETPVEDFRHYGREIALIRSWLAEDLA
jgi:deoxyribonuclease-4